MIVRLSAASGDPVRYRSGFFSPSSCGETPPPWEDAGAGSLRPLAWDFRRRRFSRNARFSRSCLESLPPAGRFAAVGCCPSPLCFSSVIVDLFDARLRMIGAWPDRRTIRIGTAATAMPEALAPLRGFGRRRAAAGFAVGAYRISLALRAITDSRTARLARAWALWQGSARPVGPIGRFPRSGHAAVAQW
jgi:hypothetical protein